MKIAVIGGGAAGMMCASAAADAKARVTLFERNEKLGKKLYITGKGRCNVTNTADMREYMQSVPRNPRFLHSAFAALDNISLMCMLEELKVPLVTERGGRVFPKSGKSSDIIKAFESRLKRLNVDIRLNSRVTEVIAKEGQALAVFADGRRLEFDAVVICTGGMTYPSTGSTGDGYSMAKSLGHSVTDLYPALTGINVSQPWAADLQGLTLKNIELKAFISGKIVFKSMGELLFAHFGVSGPLALTLSSYICGASYPIDAAMDLKPGMDENTLDKRLVRDFDDNRNKSLKNALNALLPGKLIPVVLSLISDICSPDTAVHDITRAQRAYMVRLLKNLPLTLTGPRSWSEAVITRGGIPVKEVSPKTMESRLVKGLYFAGELLDVDALTGGFNLQIAFSTGYLAGISCVGG